MWMCVYVCIHTHTNKNDKKMQANQYFVLLKTDFFQIKDELLYS